MIESLQNKKVKEWANLQNKKYRDQAKTFLVEGDHLVSEALQSGLVKEIITLKDDKYEVATFQVSAKVMKKLTSQVTPPEIMAVVRKLEEKPVQGNVLVLDGLQDPGNLGTILRSAKAFGMNNILLSDTSVDLYNPKVIRSTEGMFFSLNIIRGDLKKWLPKLKETHIIIGTDVQKGKKIEDVKPIKPIALVIGSEGLGLQVSKDFCDEFVYIPIACESLNASISASILMYEIKRMYE